MSTNGMIVKSISGGVVSSSILDSVDITVLQNQAGLEKTKVLLEKPAGRLNLRLTSCLDRQLHHQCQPFFSSYWEPGLKEFDAAKKKR
jgi:hypothetical protein